ncbi:carbamoylphosphate synthase large subunit [Candidatus Carsonella ruddii HT isolate Thao2000]|uniref:Carbamoylphosphate synthase large subunit n=1 Tax=Candidatus Carsonella ruddii HT isolate Thao2000 TaxID=1202539 RepID=J3YQB1_CARRU|nr:carbamoyl-phosphate synthase large subunit [Candidatus Carsonella ruddii]AFP84113.1 carbamoylphosphate synthase large subunit [Candidatus Carsonella ruddii HT isolate Thao2000]
MNKILVIGAGPILIGQACEFDYSGTQACKVLKNEKFNIILLNSNPATIMTDYEIADEIYIEDINLNNLIKIINKEKPNFILPTMGGQTALNCILDFIKSNYNFPEKNILGINKKTLINAESRSFFYKLIKKNGLKCPDSIIIKKNLKLDIKKIFFPCIIRSSFTLGGLGSNIVYNKKNFFSLIKKAFSFSDEIIIDRSILGWKEYELELLVDNYNNIIVICCIENIDPIGIHTGDSITITPSQTLSDKEYQNIRDCSFVILKSIGLKGGGMNIQFAINPINGDMVIIEINPRISRSSALASKATGYPIAKISTKLAIGYNLIKLINNISKNISAGFEPSIDNVVIKFPKFNFEKFNNLNFLNTIMQSIGEIMSIGKSFQETFLKGLYSILEQEKIPSFLKKKNYYSYKFKLIKKILIPNSKRIFFILDAFRFNFSIKYIFFLSKIDPWFLYYIKEIIDYEKKFFYLNKNINKIFKRIDSCSNEFICRTSYLYSSISNNNELQFSISKKILIIGSGSNKIGQSIEFDYSCVKASKFIKKIGFNSIILNCNPETVSTDQDISNKLIFDPITENNILNIIKYFKPIIIISQLGGQTSLKSIKYKNFTKEISINNFLNIICNSKIKFNIFLKIYKLNIFKNFFSKNINELIFFSNILKKPIILRPSYIIGGINIKILFNNCNLIKYIFLIKKNINIFIEKFLINYKEFDIDLLTLNGKILHFFISEHVENAGIHSGDSMIFFPCYSINKLIIKKIYYYINFICYKLKINGLINFQICYKKKIYIIECNPRASRSIPFISKITKTSLVYNYISIFFGYNIILKKNNNNFFFLKESIFPFSKFLIKKISSEMKSTGEKFSFGLSIQECFIKNYNIIKKNIFFNVKNFFVYLKYLKKINNIYTNSFYKKIFFDLNINSYVTKKKKKKYILSNKFKKIFNKNSFTTHSIIKLFLSSLNKNFVIIRKINSI